MRRFATTLALLTIALSAAACDPYAVITNNLPQGCNPGGEPIPTAHESEGRTNRPKPTLPGSHQKSFAWQYEGTRPADPSKTGTAR